MDRKEKDWQRTSTGVGHHHRPGYTFPDSTFKSIVREPLPPQLAKEDEVPKEEYFHTTYGDLHDPKHRHQLNGAYNLRHAKAPGHWKVQYVKDAAEKLQNPHFRRPLSPSNQLSEHQDEYREKTLEPEPDTFQSRPGLPKVITESNGAVRTRDPPELQSAVILRPSIIKELDPFVSTTHADHHQFEPDDYQFARQPKSDPHFSPIDRAVPPLSLNLPMRDELVFKSATKIGPKPRNTPFVPHTGLRTEAMDQFTGQGHINGKYNHASLVHSPWCSVENRPIAPKATPSAKSSIVHPYQYDTEYSNIGRTKPVTVSAKC